MARSAGSSSPRRGGGSLYRTDPPDNRLSTAYHEAGDRVRCQLNAIVESSTDAIIELALDGTIAAWNPAAAQLYGYADPEIIGCSIETLFPADRTHDVSEILKSTRLGECRQRYESTHVRKDGTHVNSSMTIAPIKDASGKISGCYLIARDIGANRLAQQLLRLKATVVRMMPEGVCLVRAVDERIIYANPKFESMFGYNPGEVNGESIHILNAAYEQTPQAVADVIAMLKENHEWTGVIRSAKKDGTCFWTFVSAVTVEHPEEGTVWVSVLTDITERRRAEETLRETNRRLEGALEELRSTHEHFIQHERLRALGQMASGIAHDFNNLLSPILGYVELPLRDSSLSNVARDRLTMIQTSACDAARVVERIQYFQSDFMSHPWRLLARGCPLGTEYGYLHWSIPFKTPHNSRNFDTGQFLS